MGGNFRKNTVLVLEVGHRSTLFRSSVRSRKYVNTFSSLSLRRTSFVAQKDGSRHTNKISLKTHRKGGILGWC